MNIFYLDHDIRLNAQYHCDKHVVKMLTEYAQVLCSTYYFTELVPDNIYKLTHKNHPCCIWARESLSNWLWLKEMSLALYKEYTHRYSKSHKAGELVLTLINPLLIDIGITTRPQAMPDEYKDNDTVTAYRNYYIKDKLSILTYKNREIPYWLKEYLNET